jgi:ubiquinone/menaquinone biosynthesis C-methylase UbiE
MQAQISDAKNLRDFYNDVYAKGDIRDNEKLYKWIVKLCEPQPDRKLLDIACGIGLVLKAGEDAGLKTYGLDISDEAVKRARAISPKSELVVGDGENLPWPEGSFDYVTSLGSLEHYLDPEKGMREISRVLSGSGTAIVMLPNSCQFGEIIKVIFTGRSSEEWQAVERHGTIKQWKESLENNGLRVIKIYGYNKYPEFFKPGTRKIKSLRKYFITLFFRYLTPFNLAQQFVYICRKG